MDNDAWADEMLMAGEDEARKRLALLRKDQQSRSAGRRALEQFLSEGSDTTDDKLASVKLTHRLDNRRVLSAVKHLLDRDLDN